MSKVIVIAEAGVNHNGDIDMAKKLIDAAADAGADYVKFQTFKSESLVSKDAKQADYQSENMGEESSQFEMLKALELREEDHKELMAHCEERGIKFLSTAFDLDSIELLDQLNLDLYKIPSGEMTNLPYLEAIASKGKDIVVSTGMCSSSEIEDALAVLTKSVDKENITVLHCNTDYPTEMADVNLNAMNGIRDQFGVKVGYSDHTLGIEVPIAAVALGATVIEKHFTLDRELSGPDHRASLIPVELRNMVEAIRNIEIALGDSEKKPSKSELANVSAARRSIHTAHSLQKGHIIQKNDLIMLRPGDGISPMKMEQVLGKSVKEDIPAHHKLDFNDLG